MSSSDNNSGGDGITTPSNPPGQGSLSYRLGDHARFFEAMKARLPTWAIPDGDREGQTPLAALSTRRVADPAIALLDAAAVVGDILTFYQERIAQESYLRTATERRSLLEIARSVGYELRPGLAAEGHVAFTIDSSPGSPEVVGIREGIRVRSLPGQDQPAQVYETVAPLEARAAWNQLRPQIVEAQTISDSTRDLYLEGNVPLRAGALILMVQIQQGGSEPDLPPFLWQMSWVKEDSRYQDGRTHIRLEPVGSSAEEQGAIDPDEHTQLFYFQESASLFGHNAADWRTVPTGIRAEYGISGDDWPSTPLRSKSGEGGLDIYYLDLDGVYPSIQVRSWLAVTDGGDGVVDETSSRAAGAFYVKEVDEIGRLDFGLAGKISQVLPWPQYPADSDPEASPPPGNYFGPHANSRRSMTVWFNPAPINTAYVPLPPSLSGASIPLDQEIQGLGWGRRVIVQGKRMRLRIGDVGTTFTPASGGEGISLAKGEILTLLGPDLSTVSSTSIWPALYRGEVVGTVTVDHPPAPEGESSPPPVAEVAPALEDDPDVSELHTLLNVTTVPGSSTLTLESDLNGIYDRSTVSIFANVAPVSHGERVDETLGSGDGRLAHQSFKLRRIPLTWLSAPTVAGVVSTLEIRVNGVLWEEVPSLRGQAPQARVYQLRLDAEGIPRITFGDGIEGARLPTGSENVVASYRSGLGAIGNVGPGRVTLMQDSPLGVRRVVNPLATTGGADPESLDEARANAPSRVLTLGRIVSRRDYEDFARAFAGISKALAAILQVDGQTVIAITVAGSSPEALAADSLLLSSLSAAMNAARQRSLPFRLLPHGVASFRLDASLRVDPTYVASDVLDRARQALEASFSFKSRALGQGAGRAEVTTVLQGVEGVVQVNVNKLGRSEDGDPPGPANWLTAKTIRMEGDELKPAELLLLDPDRSHVVLEELS